MVRFMKEDLDRALTGTGLTHVVVGGKYRIAQAATDGHKYVTEEMNLRECVIWVRGYNHAKPAVEAGQETPA